VAQYLSGDAIERDFVRTDRSGGSPSITGPGSPLGKHGVISPKAVCRQLTGRGAELDAAGELQLSGLHVRAALL
jgi:hypothetical protein